ncbi:MAG: hypothetical protein DMF80_08685 [Acidobacteria bacterium]|nr:MAG: hypothetical protein DMF80_08685 [Acidobacteriota bacterium]
MPSNRAATGESGFTIVEAMIAIVILVFGLMAVTNLMVVAGSSNTAANHGTAATSQATEVMERLKAIPFTTLTTGGSLSADVGTANCQAGNFNVYRGIPGVGVIRTRWQITSAGADVLFIAVRSESTSPLVGSRSRAEFTTFRSCSATTLGCP